MGRRFRNIENPERRIEDIEKEQGLNGYNPTNNNPNNVILTEEEFDMLLDEADEITPDGLSSDEIEFNNRINRFREKKQPESVQQEKREEGHTEIEATIDEDLRQTTEAQVQRGNSVHVAGIKKVSEIKKEEPTIFDISGDLIEETIQASSEVSNTETQEQTRTTSRGGISGTVAPMEETRSNIKKVPEVEHGKEETVQQTQEITRNSSSEEKNGIQYIPDGKTLQERLETLQEQQRQDYKTFQMSAGMDFGNGYQSDLRRNIYNTMQIRKAEMDKIKAQIDKGKTLETKEPNTQLTVQDDNKHPVLRFILSILDKLNGRVDEANKKLDEIGENENNPILKWLSRMQEKVEKVLFPESNEQNAIRTPDRSYVRGAKSIYDIMEQQIAEDSKNASREDTPHQAFVRELSGNGQYLTYGKNAKAITVPTREGKITQREDEGQEL